MHTYFSKTIHWKTYDVFSRQKASTFKSSRLAILELTTNYQKLISQLKHDPHHTKSEEEKEKAQRLLFAEVFEICLWGNATDSSLLTSLTYEDVQKLQGAEARKDAEANILVNDLPAAFQSLRRAQKTERGERKIDIVLDNAGFELFVDLILAGYLLESDLATQVVLHPKNMPWFVSDVIPADFSSLLFTLARPQEFFQAETKGKAQQPFTEADLHQLTFLFEHWSNLHSNGQLIIRPNVFWTTGYSYWNLPTHAPALFEDLKRSELVIFKGDLNYRKLTADVRFWASARKIMFANSILGKLAHHDPFCHCHRTSWEWIRCTVFGASNVQGRHSSGPSRR